MLINCVAYQDGKKLADLPIDDISDYVEKKVNAFSHYASQYGPGWKNYNPDPSDADIKQMKDYARDHIQMKDGKPVEGFRYYKGLPDALGK